MQRVPGVAGFGVGPGEYDVKLCSASQLGSRRGQSVQRRSRLISSGHTGRRALTFGDGNLGKLGHGGTQDESVPRLVESLQGRWLVQRRVVPTYRGVD